MSHTVIEGLRAQLAGTTDPQFVGRLFDFMQNQGQSHYDPSVTQLEHGLQCAALAEAQGVSASAVTGALFHDIGHLLVDEHDQRNNFLEQDLDHEEIGAAFLAPYFPEEVTEPIRLHVPAKRYLCTVDSGYFDSLSEASKRSFEGPGREDVRRRAGEAGGERPPCSRRSLSAVSTIRPRSPEGKRRRSPPMTSRSARACDRIVP